MSLQKQMLDDLNAETAVRRAAILAGTGRIAEAEVIADSLKSASLDCLALGFASPHSAEIDKPAKVIVWCIHYGRQVEQLAQALRANDLVVSRIKSDNDGDGSTLSFVGLDTELTLKNITVAAIKVALISCPTILISGCEDLTLREAFHAAKAADMLLISDGIDTCVSPIVPPGWYEIPIVLPATAPTPTEEATA